jgi:uncharacterized protein YqjF (DUF2071 family)
LFAAFAVAAVVVSVPRMTHPPPNEAQRLAERQRPAARVAMRQRWAHLLFLHWAWDAAAVQRTLPAGLTVDTHEGHAWLGLVPFFMQRVRPAGLPAVPWLSDFLELNVRTYVHDARGRPGVWFYSLDCNRWPAVKVARAFFHLPYEHAAMTATIAPGDGTVDYRARRRGTAAESRFRYRTAGEGREAARGTREFFLAERYTLFAHDARRDHLWTGRVAHAPYRIAPAEVLAWDDTMLRLAGFDPRGRAPDHACTAEAVDVEVFPLERVR